MDFWDKVGLFFIILLGFMAVLAITASVGECSWCPDIYCYGPGGCPSGCHCLIPGGETVGSCVSLQ